MSATSLADGSTKDGAAEPMARRPREDPRLALTGSFGRDIPQKLLDPVAAVGFPGSLDFSKNLRGGILLLDGGYHLGLDMLLCDFRRISSAANSGHRTLGVGGSGPRLSLGSPTPSPRLRRQVPWLAGAVRRAPAIRGLSPLAGLLG